MSSLFTHSNFSQSKFLIQVTHKRSNSSGRRRVQQEHRTHHDLVGVCVCVCVAALPVSYLKHMLPVRSSSVSVSVSVSVYCNLLFCMVKGIFIN